jgi:hypothetical protein
MPSCSLNLSGQISIADLCGSSMQNGCGAGCGAGGAAQTMRPISLQCGGTQYGGVVSTDCPFAINSMTEFRQLPILDQLSSIEFLYVQSNAPLTWRFNGTVPVLVGGQQGAPPGTFPTGFVGGESLNIEVAGPGQSPVVVTFQAADQSVQQVVNRIESEYALAGIVDRPAFVDVSGQVGLRGFEDGDDAKVNILGGSAQAALGFAAPNDEANGSSEDVPISGLGVWEFGSANAVSKVSVRGVASQVMILAAGTPR